jgi:tetratricopeptide (TPR) repeat protein
MRRKRGVDRIGGLAVVLTAIIFCMTSCGKTDDKLMEQLQGFESGTYRDHKPSKNAIRDLEKQVNQFRDEVEEKISATGQLGVYYKMLGLGYMNEEMWGKAFESFQQAILIYPENPVLFNYAAVSAARMAKAVSENPDRDELFRKSEFYYVRSIELDSGYREALYGLSILYIYELDRTEEAEEPLVQLLKVERRDIDAMFLLAGVYVYRGKTDEALELYDAIIELSTVKEKKEKALENKRALAEDGYEY